MSTEETSTRTVTVSYDLCQAHRTLEAALEGATVTIGAGDDAVTMSLHDFHRSVEQRFAQLEADNKFEADENFQLRKELVAAKKAVEFRRRKPTKTIEFERDAEGAVVRTHVFEGR